MKAGFRAMRPLAMACALLSAVQAQADMVLIEDEELAEVSGQALLVADKILPNSLSGAGGGGSSTDFTYYRIGLDAILSMNLNIDKLQLGCGGVNDALVSGVCDIDWEYVRFMGRCTTPNCGQVTDGKKQRGSGDPVTGDFIMTRPYIELAIKNDAVKTQREIVGIKIGAQSVDGYTAVGYVDNTGPGGAANVANHYGIKSYSGALNAKLSAYVRIQTALGNGAACAGRPTGYAACSGYPTPTVLIPPARTTGTRQTEIQAPSTVLCCMHGASGLLSLFEGQDQYMNLRNEMRLFHGFSLENTSDFFLSMQREKVRYPVYNKSGYAIEANTGWWMNVPSAELLDLEPPPVDLGCPGFLCTGILAALAAPGIYQQNIDLGSRAVRNCYGASEFC